MKMKPKKVYYPQTIPDTITPLLEQVSKESKTRASKERSEDIKNLRAVKHQRIKEAKLNKYTHAINTIIEWSNAGKGTIPYLYFNFYFEEQQEFAIFLDKLKNAGGFSSWTTNPYKDAYHTEIIFSNINLEVLRNFALGQESPSNHPSMPSKEPNTGTWSDDFHWLSDTKFNLGNGKSVTFQSGVSDRAKIFKSLTDVQGKWVKVADMAKVIGKQHRKVRTIILQINQEKLKKTKVIKIVPKDNTREPGAYKIILF